MENNLRNLLTVKEAAVVLRLSPCTVYRYVQQGKLPHIRKTCGLRFREDNLLAWLENGLVKPLATLPSGLLTARLLGGKGEPSNMAKSRTRSRYNLGKGGIYQRKTKQGKIRWYLDYRDETRKRVQKVAINAQTKEEAALALQIEVSKAFARGQGIKEQKKITFRDFAPVYIDSYAKPNKRSWVCDNYCLEAHLKPHFGDLDLRDISSLDIENYRAKRLEAGVKKSTTNRELALLKKMFHLALDWGFCSENPVLKVRLYSERDNLKERVLSEEEEVKLLAHSPAHLKPIVLFAINTGMRRGEILGLRWDQIERGGKAVRVVRTKSGQDRYVPLNETAADVIKAQRLATHGEFVFPSTKGGEHFKAVCHSFSRACRLAGISGLRFHDLRHTFATRLIHRGADIVTVQNLLGHHSVTITQRYTHIGADRKRSAVDLLVKKSDDLLHSCDTGVTEKSCVRANGSTTAN